MLGTIGGQFDILEKLQTSTVARMFQLLKPERVRVIRGSMSAEERSQVAARLREEGYEEAAQIVLE